MRYALDVNGRRHEVEVDEGTPLLTVLRETLGLTGSRFGCGQGDCGACYVMLDGSAVAACRIPIGDAEGRAIVTIEGLAKGDELHPVQRAFIDEDAMQCGFCTSGMIISAAALLARRESPSDDDIVDALEPHLCRCGVYERAVRAVRRCAR